MHIVGGLYNGVVIRPEFLLSFRTVELFALPMLALGVLDHLREILDQSESKLSKTLNWLQLPSLTSIFLILLGAMFIGVQSMVHAHLPTSVLWQAALIITVLNVGLMIPPGIILFKSYKVLTTPHSVLLRTFPAMVPILVVRLAWPIKRVTLPTVINFPSRGKAFLQHVALDFVMEMLLLAIWGISSFLIDSWEERRKRELNKLRKDIAATASEILRKIPDNPNSRVHRFHWTDDTRSALLQYLSANDINQRRNTLCSLAEILADGIELEEKPQQPLFKPTLRTLGEEGGYDRYFRKIDIEATNLYIQAFLQVPLVPGEVPMERLLVASAVNRAVSSIEQERILSFYSMVQNS
ncbi:hypothetical protein FGG08_001139 [Glutinoglossum americanum]|uniref:Uncharacterized protein n=1 Tax=Glutinoglossum americanum TaxID=1670608 RepID=A0A9P8I8W5_9PEZI|nr:hypothetical protein FGG08_001139 [Glutinoglossum americanum]